MGVARDVDQRVGTKGRKGRWVGEVAVVVVCSHERGDEFTPDAVCGYGREQAHPSCFTEVLCIPILDALAVDGEFAHC